MGQSPDKQSREQGKNLRNYNLWYLISLFNQPVLRFLFDIY